MFQASGEFFKIAQIGNKKVWSTFRSKLIEQKL